MSIASSFKKFAVKGNRKAEEEGVDGVEKFCVLGLFCFFMEMFIRCLQILTVSVSLYMQIYKEPRQDMGEFRS